MGSANIGDGSIESVIKMTTGDNHTVKEGTIVTKLS